MGAAVGRASPCPHCHQSLNVPPQRAGQRAPCPACGQIILLTVAEEPVEPEVIEPSPSALTPPPAPAPIVEASIIDAGESPLQRTAKSSSGPSFLSQHPRLLRHVIFWGIWIGPIAAILLLSILSSITSDNPISAVLGFICVLAVLGLPWLLLGGWVARYATPLIMSGLVKATYCPHCHEAYELTSRWGCGCGYVDHRDRHFYMFRCPNCRSYLGSLQCQRCNATMLL